MSAISIFNLAVAVFSIILGIVVYQRDPRNDINQYFGVFCGLTAFCSYTDSLINNAINVSEVYYLLHMVSIRMLLFTVLLHFFIIYNGSRVLRKWWFLVPCYGITLYFIVVGVPEEIFIVKHIPGFNTWSFWAGQKNYFNLMMSVWVILEVTFVNVLGIQMVLRERRRRKQAQILFLLSGVMISLFLPLLTDILVPFSGNILPQLGTLSFALGNFIIGYSVFRHGLFSYQPGELTREILNNISDSVIITDTNSKICFVNNACRQMTGLDESELLDREIDKLFVKPVHDELRGLSSFPSANTMISAGTEKQVVISFSSSSGSLPGIKEKLFIIHDVSDLHQSISKLRISEEKYKNVFENILDIYIEITPEGTIGEISPSCEEITKFRREELLNSAFSDIFVDAEDYKRLSELLASHGSVQGFELQLLDKNGKELFFQGNLKTVYSAKGIPNKIVGALSEISSLKASEARLRESEKKYRALIESSSDPIYMLDANLTILAANAQLARVARKPEGFNTVGKRLYEVLPEKFVAPFKLEIAEVFKTGKQKIVTNEVELSTGELFWYSTSLSPIRDQKEDKVLYVIVIVRDITIHTKTEEIIRKNEEKYRFFLENFPGIIYRADLFDNLEFIFGEMEQLTGYTRDQLMTPGFSFQQLIHKADQQRVMNNYSDLVNDKCKDVAINFRIVCHNGSIKNVRAYFHKSMESSGDSKFIEGVIYDNTNETETSERIMDAVIETEERERLRFSEDLHDELGPMLSSIRMYINTIQAKNKAEQERERMLLLEQSIVLIDDAISQARNISRNLMPELLNDYGLLPAVKSFCNQVNSARTVSIDLQLADVDEAFRFSHIVELALFRVIKELISNTLKHAQAGNIIIKFTKRRTMLLVEYFDDGIGFDFKDNLNKKGSLGLKNIVNRIGTVGGSIHFSTTPDGGTMIFIEVPADEVLA